MTRQLYWDSGVACLIVWAVFGAMIMGGSLLIYQGFYPAWNGTSAFLGCVGVWLIGMPVSFSLGGLLDW